MRRFSRLVWALDETNRTSEKVEALRRYFEKAPAEDAAWALHVLTGRRVKRAIQGGRLREWVAEEAGLPLWLLERCYEQVGDLAETLARVLPRPTEQSNGSAPAGSNSPRSGRDESDPDASDLDASGPDGSIADWPLHHLFERVVLPLPSLDDDEKRERLIGALAPLGAHERFVVLKLITGAFRLGVGARLVTRALALVAEVDPATMAHRISGGWTPTAETFRGFLAGDDPDDPARPYPFFLAPPLDGAPEALGPIEHWQAEWKWDGIRLQVIHRRGETLLWSRGEELVTDQFPELATMASALPDGTVLDGEALAWRDDRPLGFAALQRRLGRKKIGPKLLREVPVSLMAYDVMEAEGVDVRDRPLSERRRILERIVESAHRRDLGIVPHLRVSERVSPTDWTHLEQLRSESRERGVEGFMLKALESAYGVGRVRGSWWKWKVEPLTLDVALIYAQAGRGRRAGLHTDYTLAVRHAEEWVPIAKAYSGLSNAELRQMDRWIRRNTIEKFGPVRSVPIEHLFEIAFEGIRRSTRHKSGIALRFPRIARWRKDKPVGEANTLDDALALLERVE